MVRLVGVILVIVSLASAALAAPGFEVREYLNRTWRNEGIRYPIAGENLARAQAGKALVSQDGKAVLYQLTPAAQDGTGACIEFLTDLAPFETRTYAFTEAPAAVSTDLRIEEMADVIRVKNSQTGIMVRKQLAPGQLAYLCINRRRTGYTTLPIPLSLRIRIAKEVVYLLLGLWLTLCLLN